MKKERFSLFKDIFFALKILMQSSPMFIIGGILTMTAFFFFRNYIQEVLFLKKLLEIITGGGTFRQFVILLLIFCVAGLLAKAVDCIGDYFSHVCSRKVYKKLNERILKKASEVDVECYENPEFYDKYQRATEIITNGIYFNFQYHICSMVSGIVSGVFLVIYISSVDPRLLLILLSVIAIIAIKGIKAKIEYNKDKEMTVHKRHKAYVQRVVFLRDYSKDMRTSGIYNVMNKRFNEAIDANRKLIKKYGKGLAAFEITAGIVAEAFPIIATYAYGAYRFIVKKNLKIADFSVLMTAIGNIRNVIVSISTDITELQKNAVYFRNLRDFFNYENHTVNGTREADEIKSIEFKNVSFTYPGAEKPSLKNVSFEIKGNETVAIVGKNGAGKSTFVKLLLRFYDPNEGEIFYNGINIKEYDIVSLRERIGTVFQDYKVFALTVNENVLCRECETEEDRILSEKALKASGAYAKIRTLPQGAETQLTREFDKNGTGLSGGEAQKVAAARMFAHSFDMAVLDEPSSALDPIAEYKMYESLIEATKDKMVIYISHRLSSAVLSDKVFVFDNGEIVENGTHNELMTQNGIYANMFTLQASNYKDSGEEEAI
ncbi:MAG: ABC transporter ATP-binding protein [Clostridia bacterium]|nr:ABC transporter ATP-binding protein [Clostridia bacterium]